MDKSKTRADSRLKLIGGIFLSLALAYLLSVPIYLCAMGIVQSVHVSLARAFEQIPLYNSVTDPELYALQTEIRMAISATLTLTISAALAVLLSGAKRHYFFNKTHGMYKMKAGLERYAREFLLLDLFALLVVGPLFTLAAYLLPLSLSEGLRAGGGSTSFLSYLIIPFLALKESLSPYLSVIISVAAPLLGTLISIPISVRSYRATALTHSIE